jgi:hypothetical protein
MTDPAGTATAYVSLTVAVATLPAGCTSKASIWHREGTTQEVTSADITAGRAGAEEDGYGLVAGADYLQRCIVAKGYRPADQPACMLGWLNGLRRMGSNAHAGR